MSIVLRGLPHALLAAVLLLPAGGIASAAAPTTAASFAASPAAASSIAAANPTAFVQVAAGEYYSTALRADGTVWAWGRTLFGELGALESRVTSDIDRPVRLFGLPAIAAISTNGVGTQTGVATDGTVWEWGSRGAIQGGTTLPTPIPGLQDVKAAVPGFALKKDGTLWRWTYEPQAGDKPKIAVAQVAGTYRFASMTAKGDLVYAIDGAGAVWGFGAVRKHDGSGFAPLTPARLAGFQAMKQLSAYQDRLVGVDTSGRAWQAQLDFDALYQQAKAGPVKLKSKPTRLALTLKAEEAEIAYFGSVLIRTTGGDVWTTNGWLTGKAGKIGGWSGIREIAAGYHHGLGIDLLGRLWGIGGNQWFEAGSPNVNDARMLYKPALVLPAIGVQVDGKPLASGYPAAMAAGRAYVPLKDTVRALGGTFKAAQDGTYEIALGEAAAVFRFSDLQATINGSPATLAGKPYTSAGAVMVPASLFKQLGLAVVWNAKSSELSLNKA
ncbi:Regulator of chromosome condensation (RCC1) repeat-containing protein [Cohnella sp. OV330]|uniref:stalk domain-containing protein n=1 Tax=Cohnella sp. OV330 TaxID=1855288 RepID=UPI0008E5E92D|nr:stalk domain-containing protein [Cohnella sp. OV330]SFB10341.1 Regulator of chromosome condensation (RCC1) repeat-containing protein [Cohnella sp. OV330]